MRATSSINLASEPFRRDRASLAAGIGFLLALAGLLAFQIRTIVQERESLAESRGAVEEVNRQVAGLAGLQSKLDGELRRPDNAEVLERSVFINEILRRKGISWTGIFADLEEVIPHNVRLVSIRPKLDGDNRIQLEMVVGAQAPEPVIEMLMKLEGSPLFGASTVAVFLPPSQSEPLHRYRVNVNYAQKL